MSMGCMLHFHRGLSYNVGVNPTLNPAGLACTAERDFSGPFKFEDMKFAGAKCYRMAHFSPLI